MTKTGKTNNGAEASKKSARKSDASISAGRKNKVMKGASTSKQSHKAAATAPVRKNISSHVHTTSKKTIRKSDASKELKGARSSRSSDDVVAAITVPVLKNIASHAHAAFSLAARASLDSDEALLRALDDDATGLYEAIDGQESQKVAKALSKSHQTEVREDLKILAAAPGADATIYMVSNRPTYLRTNPNRYGVREVTIHTNNRTAQVGHVEINEVPLVENENVLLFVHGFNNSVDDAAIAAWKLGNNLQGIDKTVFFSWPSEASVFSYSADYKIANKSVPFVVDCIDKLTKGRVGKVHIVAHSMGCRLLVQSLIEYLNIEGAAKLGQVYFIAGDVDQFVFNLSMTRIGGSEIATNLTNIASDNDYALKLALKVHWDDRAGLYPPVMSSPDKSPSFMSLMRPGSNKDRDSHSYFNAKNIRADISNQVVLYHTESVPKPEDIRSTYKSPRGVKNALVMRAL